MINRATVHEINGLLSTSSECQVIDVREPSEFRAEHVAKAKLIPLSKFESSLEEIDRSKPVYLMCRSGIRAAQAAQKLSDRGFSDIHVVDGGIAAWAAAKLPTVKSESKVWPLERQVRFTAGAFVFVGVMLGYFVNPSFYAFSAFVGAGLVFSAVTNTCTMAMVLAKMPWNR